MLKNGEDEYIFSYWKKLLQHLPCGPVLEIYLFTIYNSDLFLALPDAGICNLGDITTSLASDQIIENISTKLKKCNILVLM